VSVGERTSRHGPGGGAEAEAFDEVVEERLEASISHTLWGSRPANDVPRLGAGIDAVE
jgi:hypothetical protein